MTITDAQIELGQRAVDVAAPALWCNGLHTVVTLHDDGRAECMGAVYSFLSSAQRVAVIRSDATGRLHYTVARHGDKFAVYGGVYLIGETYQPAVDASDAKQGPS